jgi:hypothetical protein
VTRTPLFQTPESDVVVCPAKPVLRHVTRSPALIDTLEGLNAKSTIAILVSAASAADQGAAAAIMIAATPSPASGAVRRRFARTPVVRL